VLTGDKTETALNIGYSAGLLVPEMVLIRMQNRGQSVWALQLQLEGLVTLFKQIAADKTNIDRIYANMQNSVNAIIFGKKHVKPKVPQARAVGDESVDLSPMQGMRRRKIGTPCPVLCRICVFCVSELSPVHLYPSLSPLPRPSTTSLAIPLSSLSSPRTHRFQ
jgi:magnesium-transporting ATPase (P-type)